MTQRTAVLAGLMLALLGGRTAQGAECYEGVWSAPGAQGEKRLEINADGCLKLQLPAAAPGAEAVLHDTCYKVKKKSKTRFVVAIEEDGRKSTAELTCGDRQLRLKWGELADDVFTPVTE